MPAARCFLCNLNFPVSIREQLCPVCQLERLDGIQNEDPDDPNDLLKAVTNARFERYLEKTGRM